jgi:hypothetical protein
MTARLCTPEWLDERCHRDEDGCLIWRNQVDGYNMPVAWTPMDEEGKRYRVMVRRDALMHRLGRAIRCDKVVICTCGKDRCVEHLAEVSRAEVIRRTWTRPDVRARKMAAITKASRARGKLDMEKARAIRESSALLKDLSAEFGISMTLASQIRRGLAWTENRNPFRGLGA